MSDWKSMLATIAPGIATALGGPVAGMAVRMATTALGIESTPEALEQMVASGDPDAMLKLKTVEVEFQKRVKELEIDLEKVHAGDRASARDLAIAKGVRPQAILSGIFVIAFAGLLFMMFSGEVAPGMKEPFLYLLGILSAGIIQIMNFWFGSSSGSKAKVSAPGSPT